MKKISYLFILFSVISLSSSSQSQNLSSLIKQEVLDAHVMFKKTVWRRMDLTERQNVAFFAGNSGLPKLLLDAVEEGLINSYTSDSCINFMSDNIFKSNIAIERRTANDDFGGFNDFGGNNNGQSSNNEPVLEPIPAILFSVAYIKEDIIFDRNRSRMYFYIQTITLALPRDAGTIYNPGGFEKPVAHFKYKEVLDLFRGPYKDKALYFNDVNHGAHLNLSDGFELRLFNAPIIKLSNARDLDIRQIYSDQLSNNPLSIISIQQKYEYNLMEYESDLWEN